MASDESVDLWLFIDIVRNTRAYRSLRKNPKRYREFRKSDFQEKEIHLQVLALDIIMALRQLQLASRTPDDLVLAKAHIRHIVAPVGQRVKEH
ncbi:MAG: hypothetical protein Q9184_002134 [Pyrenodesmia sp. 2 TL-2023]